MSGNTGMKVVWWVKYTFDKTEPIKVPASSSQFTRKRFISETLLTEPAADLKYTVSWLTNPDFSNNSLVLLLKL